MPKLKLPEGGPQSNQEADEQSKEKDVFGKHPMETLNENPMSNEDRERVEHELPENFSEVVELSEDEYGYPKHDVILWVEDLCFCDDETFQQRIKEENGGHLSEWSREDVWALYFEMFKVERIEGIKKVVLGISPASDIGFFDRDRDGLSEIGGGHYNDEYSDGRYDRKPSYFDREKKEFVDIAVIEKDDLKRLISEHQSRIPEKSKSKGFDEFVAKVLTAINNKDKKSYLSINQGVEFLTENVEELCYCPDKGFSKRVDENKDFSKYYGGWTRAEIRALYFAIMDVMKRRHGEHKIGIAMATDRRKALAETRP